MKLDLDKIGLRSLVMGTSPSYNIMSDPRIKPHGEFRDQYSRWDWNNQTLFNCTEEELLVIYLLCKGSW